MDHYIHGTLVVDCTTELLRDTYRNFSGGVVTAAFTGSFMPHDATLAPIAAELYKRCKHCGEKKEVHTSDGKCLFQPTRFEKGAKP